MKSLTVTSPAKLNLNLHILGRRRDGYHELLTLFHRISLRDTLRLSKRKAGIRIFCRHPRVPKKNNLIVRAFDLLQTVHPFKEGVSVYLQKRIPVGGGLGGGSSNAAAFLLAANRFFRLGLGRAQLMKIGARIGSDVPFFISGAACAIGQGRGERIRPLPLRRRLWFLLFPRSPGLSTRDVYRNFRTSPPPPSLTRLTRDVKIFHALLEKGKFKEASGFFVNDLTESAERMCPSLRKARENLSALDFGTCQMSGSGPTQFILFPTRSSALGARSILRRKGIQKIILCHSA